MSGRFVVVGVASTRSPWFSDVARWTTSGLIAAEYTQAMSIEEVRAVLGSGKKISAVIAGSGTIGLDREFMALTTSLDVAVVVVEDHPGAHDWDSLGVAERLPRTFSPDDLRDALERHAKRIDPRGHRNSAVSVSVDPDEPLAPLIAVTGAGGSGVSTIAMALASGIGSRTPGDGPHERTALADLTRSGDLTMYHDVGDVIPGLPELVEAHRGDTPDPETVRDLLFEIPDRPYELLLGQRRNRDSAAMAPLSTAAAIDGLRRSYAFVVADVDPTVDGEAETGSVDIELFNAAQRHAFGVASVLVVVSNPGMRGIRRMSTLLATMGRCGVPAERVLPVWNRAPRGPSARAAMTRLTSEISPLDQPVHPPLFTRHSRLLEDVHHSVGPMPNPLVEPVTRAALAMLDDLGSRVPDAPAPMSGANRSERRLEVA